jgi:glycosyltransferase involved in cell wall biosynthesis
MIPILIPAYQPDEKLTNLVTRLQAIGLSDIVVVDDGSRKDTRPLFDDLARRGCVVLRHAENQGKGAAIKTGIRNLIDQGTAIDGIVTCDADGQHDPKDVAALVGALTNEPESLVLGTRDFGLPQVPKTSRFGNRFSAMYFRFVTGRVCNDTQTGLRGIPRSLFPLALSIPQNRYDYEMTFLIDAAISGTPFRFVPIETVYIDQNASSHFRPIVDSIRIYKEPLKFTAASLLCTGLDLGLFALILFVLNSRSDFAVVMATIAARLVSGVFNFTLNRKFSFRSKHALKPQLIRYGILYAATLLASAWTVHFLADAFGFPVLFKAIVDLILFVIGFSLQRNWVFAKPKKTA